MLTEPTVSVPAAFLSLASFKCSCCSVEVGVSGSLMDEAARPRCRCDCCCPCAVRPKLADFLRVFFFAAVSLTDCFLLCLRGWQSFRSSGNDCLSIFFNEYWHFLFFLAWYISHILFEVNSIPLQQYSDRISVGLGLADLQKKDRSKLTF